MDEILSRHRRMDPQVIPNVQVRTSQSQRSRHRVATLQTDLPGKFADIEGPVGRKHSESWQDRKEEHGRQSCRLFD